MPRAAPPPSRQFDLFMDAPDVQWRNDAVAALLRHDFDAAEEAIRQLRQYAPDDAALPALAELLIVLDEWPWPVTALSLLESAILRCENRVGAAARRALGRQADVFMARLWQDLAQAAQPLPFQAERPGLHAAPLFLRAGEPEAAIEAARSVPDWSRQPEVLRWLVLASYRLAEEAPRRAYLFSFAFRAPERLAALIAELDDILLRQDWEAFEASPLSEQADARLGQWFPAWCLIRHPGLAAPHDGDDSGYPDCSGATAFRLLRQILALEKSGVSQALTDARARLNCLNPSLFEGYMLTRQTRYL